jgi:hypothetical protein
MAKPAKKASKSLGKKQMKKTKGGRGVITAPDPGANVALGGPDTFGQVSGPSPHMGPAPHLGPQPHL